MNQALTLGLPAVAVAAALYGSAPVLQAAAARRSRPGSGLGLRLLGRLALRPLWLLGLVCEIGGFAAEAYAFSVAPAALVAPLLTADMVFLVLLARRGLGERLAATGSLGILTIVLGTALMALAFSEESALGSPASHGQMLAFAIGGAVAAAVFAVVGDRGAATGQSWLAAVGFGVGSGIAYGIATLATRQVGLTFDIHNPWPIFATPTPYVLAVFSVIATALLQRGLQTGASVLTFPVTSWVSSFLPVVLGTTVLGDVVPSSGQRVAFVVALVAVAAGVAFLGRDRAAAERQFSASPAEAPYSRPEAHLRLIDPDGPKRATVDVMRSVIVLALGVLVALAGLLFTLQGFGAVSGSPMSNTTTWSVLGPVIALIGIAIAIAGWRARR